MLTEITATDWISAIATAFACLATFILAVIAWRQYNISDQQRKILSDHAEIFSRQAFYQGQQTTISQNQAEISKQQLTIIKDQEADRKNAAMRADLVVTSRAEGDNVLDLILENKGSGWAREIMIYIEGYSLEECPPEKCRLQPGTTAQTEIGPGNKLDYLLEFPGTTPPTNLRVDVKWVSDNGMRSTTLAFIIPRQRLEAYRREHKKPASISTARNGPRMDAYAKFMTVISVRPDTHYAEHAIVPQLETIQLFASPEVKGIAKDIHDWTKTETRRSGRIPHLPDFMNRINTELKPIIAKEIEDLQVDTESRRALLTARLLKQEKGVAIEIHNRGNAPARNLNVSFFGRTEHGTLSGKSPKPFYSEASIPANESMFLPAEFPGWEEIYVNIKWDDDSNKDNKITIPIPIKPV
jgi:hypothetical protein